MISKIFFKEHFKNIFLKHDIFVAIDDENIISRQRFVLFRIFSLSGAAASLGVFIKMWIMFTEINLSHWLLPALSCIMLINFFRIKTPLQLDNAYFTVILSAFTLLHIVAYTTGGIRSASILFFPVVILYAFMLLGKTRGQYFTILFGIHVIYIFLISRYTHLTSFDFLQNNPSHIEEDFLFNALFAFFLVAAQSTYLNSGRNVVLKKVTEQRDQLAKKNLLLQQSNLTLEKANKELDQFAYIVSHDLKAPLRAIGNLAGWIEEDSNEQLPKSSSEHLTTIVNRVSRMEALINGILHYSKTTRLEEPFENIDLRRLICETIDLLNASKMCELKISENLPLFNSSRTKLQQVFLNLLNNAIMHNDKQPSIQIIITNDENNFHFVFKDNGPGIESKYFDRIFKIFQTLQPRDQFESTGLGLALVKRIIDDAGGKIWIESEPGNGSEFHFVLPVNEKQRILITPASEIITGNNTAINKVPARYIE